MPNNQINFLPETPDAWLDQLAAIYDNQGLGDLGSLYALKTRYSADKAREKRKICECFVCNSDILDGDQAFRYGVRDDKGECNQIYCGKCSSKFRRCYHCRGSFKSSEFFMEHCPYCVEDAPRRLIRNYTTKVHRELPKLGNPTDGIFYGVELEYECRNYGRDTLITDGLVRGFALLKRDSSIIKGFEVVSSPATIDKHLENFGRLFDQLPRTVVPDNTCGMHVHVSRVRLSDLQIGKMMTFIHNPDNEKFITTIAGRGSNRHNDFKSPKKITEGLFGGQNQVNKDRHTALNLNNESTIEFRLFKGTRDKYVLAKNLEFCRALVKFTGWSNYSIQESKNFQVFYNFIRQNRKEYQTLWNFLTKARIFDRLR